MLSTIPVVGSPYIGCEDMKTPLVIVKCSHCRRIKVNNNWVREPDFLSRDIEHSHSYCPACLNLVMEEAESWSGSPDPATLAPSVLIPKPALMS
jgi:hypothetical protein